MQVCAELPDLPGQLQGGGDGDQLRGVPGKHGAGTGQPSQVWGGHRPSGGLDELWWDLITIPIFSQVLCSDVLTTEKYLGSPLNSSNLIFYAVSQVFVSVMN